MKIGKKINGKLESRKSKIESEIWTMENGK
jgi:hypothetical protein